MSEKIAARILLWACFALDSERTSGERARYWRAIFREDKMSTRLKFEMINAEAYF
jgi:hypothetical protein